MALTPKVFSSYRQRADSTQQGRACGQGYIAAGKTCHKKGSFPARKAIATGLVAGGALAAGVYAYKRRNRIQPANIRVSYNNSARINPGASRKALPGDRTTRRLRGTSPKGLLPPGPPRMGRTARMRRNTGEAVRIAERRIAQTAREEVRRIAQIGNTMAATGEATGMAAKTGWREMRLRVEAARRRYEPGYRRPSPVRLPRLLSPGAQAEPVRIPLTPRTVSPQRVRRRRDSHPKG